MVRNRVPPTHPFCLSFFFIPPTPTPYLTVARSNPLPPLHPPTHSLIQTASISSTQPTHPPTHPPTTSSLQDYRVLPDFVTAFHAHIAHLKAMGERGEAAEIHMG